MRHGKHFNPQFISITIPFFPSETINEIATMAWMAAIPILGPLLGGGNDNRQEVERMGSRIQDTERRSEELQRQAQEAEARSARLAEDMQRKLDDISAASAAQISGLNQELEANRQEKARVDAKVQFLQTQMMRLDIEGQRVEDLRRQVESAEAQSVRIRENYGDAN